MKRTALLGLLLVIALSSAGVRTAQAEPSAIGGFTGCDNPSDQTDIPTKECKALVALYNSTNGGGWISRTGWKDTNTPCSWFGVTCTSDHVTEIKLNSNNLVGTIPVKLEKLSKLEMLYLYTNGLTGRIPKELGNLTKLERLEIDGNSLSGKIPKQLGNLSNLTLLRLESNDLSSSIPPQLGNLSNLTYLSLYNNNLSGIVPSKLGDLTILETLYIHNNSGLGGWLPSSLTNLGALTAFNFVSTSLCERPDGTFQTWLSGITTLASTGVTCTNIFTDGFESGDLGAWDAANIGGGDLSACTKAALNGTYGLCVKNKTNNVKWVTDWGMSESWLSAQFNLDPNDLDLQNKKKVFLFHAWDVSNSTHWLQLRKKSGKFQLRALANLDGSGKVKTKWQKIANKAHLIEIEWMAATGAGNNDGYLSLFIDDRLKQSKRGLDTDTLKIDHLFLGFTNSPASFSVSGVFFIDDFASSGTGYIGK